MLSATATISDNRLEPTDSTRLTVTVRNDDPEATADNVQTTVVLRGGDQPGLELLPDDRCFGSIRPCESVSKEFAIVTERAEPDRDHEVAILLSFDVSRTVEETDTICFRVDGD